MRFLTLAAAAALFFIAAPAHAVPPVIPAVIARIEAAPGFSGIVGARRGGSAAHYSWHGRGGTRPWRPVRWASVTKSVTAVLVLQEVDAGRLSLDAPLSRYLPDWPVNGDATLRQLLMHTSGLADLSASPDADGDGMPDVYQGIGDWRTTCALSPRAAAGAGFAYNNCDYLLLGAVLEAVTGQGWPDLVRTRIREPLGLVSLEPASPGVRSEAFDGAAPEPAVDVSTYGPAGDLYGGVEAMLGFDQALMDGRLISDAARAEMWKAGPETGYGGLSVWVYDLALPGCGIRTRVVERQGAIGGVQVRNYLMPDLNAALVIWTDDGAFDPGETWTGQGFGVDLLAAVACADGQGSAAPA
ncbi:MAG TPA: serine hydrolase domain-containing protein [Brevundimonas sp.]|uniref:serine hydrolase domain-containing protein n=1 Tax=Brevundimonas sp. TaxID=1871086 RepID=UPI002DF44D64|nr:serine hydrolase domain-containing protein [Brevundimonas sp.]